jgi:hypothetical protein
MSDAGWTAVAALGAAALTALASLGVVAYQQWRHNAAASRASLHAAIIELLARSVAVMLRSDSMRLAVEQRSGLKEGIDITTRTRKPIEPLELHDWLAQDWAPLTAAWSEIWTRGDSQTVRLANDLVGKCGNVLGMSTSRAAPTTVSDRLHRWLVGERWSPEMLEAHKQAQRELAEARKRLAEHARTRLKLEAVDMFSQVEHPVQPN